MSFEDAGPAGSNPGGETNSDDEDGVYPATLREREIWVAWILDGKDRKRPVAPWQTGHAYPAEWRGEIPEDESPETNFETVRKWLSFSLSELGLSLPEDAKSEELRLGIVLPTDRPPRDERITVIDWDDVRDPETGEIHPVAAAYIEYYGGYVEVSRSRKGLHQFVFGGFLGDRGKLIAPIDDEPFIGEDRPGVEIYDGGRHVAMTGQHVPGTDRDVVEGQDYINALVTEFTEAEIEAGHRSPDQGSGGRRSATTVESAAVASSEAADQDTAAVALGDGPDELPNCYANALVGRTQPEETGYATAHTLDLHIALLGVYAGYDDEELVEHLRKYPPDGRTANFDEQITRSGIEGTRKKVKQQSLAPPSESTLRENGIIDSCDCWIHSGAAWRDGETRSEYYDVDLGEFVDDGEPWTDPETMLRACLQARDAGAVPEYAAPPKLALLPLRRDVLEQRPSRDMSSGTKELLDDLFHELTVNELDEVLHE